MDDVLPNPRITQCWSFKPMNQAKALLRQSIQAILLLKPNFANSIALSNFDRYQHRIKSVEIELSKDSMLGTAGQVICMPIDNVIMPWVLETGEWEPDIIKFVEDSTEPQAVYDVIDVGANCGLFTRQILLSGIRTETAVCIEADLENFRCMQKNLDGFAGATLFNIGLGHEDAILHFFKDRMNHGNHSFLRIKYGPDSLPDKNCSVSDVPMRETRDFFAEIGGKLSNKTIWKSDTQGFDEIIVSRTPDALWLRVSCAIIELTRVGKPAFDRQAFGSRIAQFKTMHLGSQNLSSVDDVLAFTDGQDGKHENLFLVR